MKKNEIKVGSLYVAKVGANITTVRVDAIREIRNVLGFGTAKDYTRYDVTNVKTGRKTTFRSAMKFRKALANLAIKTDNVLAKPGYNADGSKGLTAIDATRRGEKFEGGSVMTAPQVAHVAQIEAKYSTGQGATEAERQEAQDLVEGTPETTKEERADLLASELAADRSKRCEVADEPVLVSVIAPQPPVQNTSKLSGLAARLATQPKEHPHVIVEARAGTGKTFTIVVGIVNTFRDKIPGLWDKLVATLGFDPQPSPQQQAVWDAMKLSVDARTVQMTAFNKSIVREFETKWGWVIEALRGAGITLQFATNHSMGYAAIRKAFRRRLEVSEYRVTDLIATITGVDVRELRRTKFEMLKATEKLVSLCKMNLADTDEESLDAIASHYDIEFNGCRREVFELVPQVLEACKDPTRDGRIDYDDMVWLPVALDLPMFRNDLLLVDECLPGWTPVMLADGRSMTIQEIVESPDDIRVRSYDTKTGSERNCLVTAKQRILNQKPLVKVRVKHLHRTGTNKKTNFVICTTDHKLWTVNRGWVEAGQIQVGDNVIVETAAQTTQKGKITYNGRDVRDVISQLLQGNKRGLGNVGGTISEANRGGNGRGPTLAEQTLLDELNAVWPGWVYNYPIPTGAGHRGIYPTCYKSDIAHPELMLSVEVDGASHTNRQEQDEKKTDLLQKLGWLVFRTHNKEAVQRPKDVIARIHDTIDGMARAANIECDGSNCPRPAKVVSVDTVVIPDNYVYDITVEDCHNFYANGILVHNCQDLNRSQQALAKKAGKRLVLVGDPKQAIYSFAGADAESMARMERELSATTQGCSLLRLTVTRRCGHAIVKEANKIVSDFAAHESNHAGSVSEAAYPTYEQDGRTVERPWDKCYLSRAQSGDFVLCRVNAPLVSNCFRFIKRGIKANIQGRDIGAGLVSTIEKLKAQSINDLVAKVSDWLQNELSKEQAKRLPLETRMIALNDRADCLVVFTEGATSVAGVIDKIKSVFTDDKQGGGIRLSSIHRAKGLEANRVFILQPKGATMPHPMAKTDWQRSQEYNLLYVGITRAIKELVYVY